MNGFEKHGITHLSHSQIDDWIESQAMWCIKHLGRIKDRVGPGAWRGTAAERGLKVWLTTSNEEAALAAAMASFDAESAVAFDPGNVAEERRLLPRYLQQAIYWARLTEVRLINSQINLQTRLDDIPVPFECWIDFEFDNGCVDMKTRKSLIFKGSDDRQLAIYEKATGKPQGLLCVTPSRYEHRSYGGNKLTIALDQVRREALRMERFLSRIDSGAEALSILSFNPENWKVTDTILTAHAQLTGA